MIEKVRTWLDEQGYTLEMQTAAALRSVGYVVQQSSHFLDPETNKSREIDVVASESTKLGILNIALIVECKQSKKPWVVLGSTNTLDDFNSLFSLAVLSQLARTVLVDNILNLEDVLPWFKKGPIVGYNIRQAHTDNDTAYAAAISVAKATHAWIHSKSDPECDYMNFGFPIIVTDAPILVCTLDDHGKIQLNEVEESEFLFIASLPQEFATCIRIMTLARLRTFATEARQITSDLRVKLAPEELKQMDKITARWETNRDLPGGA